MSQYPDARIAHQPQAPQFPPPSHAAVAQPLPPHMAPEQYATQLAQQAAEQSAAGPDPMNNWESPVGEGDGAYTDYFGNDQVHRYMMSDGRQYIEFKTMNEGDLAFYHQLLNRDVTVEKTTGNARIKINQVEERHALLQVSVIGWHMMQRDPRRGWVEVPFGTGKGPGSTFMQWMKKADPRVISDLEEAVRKENPFLLAANTETLEAIDKQIEDLYNQRKLVEERMAGNADSATS